MLREFLQGIYFALAGIRNFLYDVNFFKQIDPEIPVISIGNVSWGGTGKTEFVRLILQRALLKGRCPVVVSRGYGCRFKDLPREISIEDGALCDEPAMIKQTLPNAHVFIGPRREEAIAFARGKYPSIDLCILDDGFQYRRLRRAVDVVLITPRDSWFREPFSSVARADVVVINKVADLKVAKALAKRLSRWAKGPVVGAQYQLMIPSVREGFLVCGIARPDELMESLVRRGIELKDVMVFRDHYPYQREDVKRVVKRAKALTCAVLTTRKDWVKLSAFGEEFEKEGIRVVIIDVEIEFLWGKEEFWQVINRVL